MPGSGASDPPAAATPVVVIPIPAPQLRAPEQLSLQRACRLLAAHPLVLLCPEGRAAAIAEAVAAVVGGGARFTLHPVPDPWMASVRAYNQLMLRPAFYAHYRAHSHLLIHQLDATVFADELLAWCGRPWDYIGPPCYGPDDPFDPLQPAFIGVGGLSLRRVAAFEAALAAAPLVFRHRDLRRHLRGWSRRGRLVMQARWLACRLSGGCRLPAPANGLAHWLGINEDRIFGRQLPAVLSSFRVAPYDEAVRFGIDRHPAEQLRRLGRLPFGAHAWWTLPGHRELWDPWLAQT